jgi:hypothetical protein
VAISGDPDNTIIVFLSLLFSSASHYSSFVLFLLLTDQFLPITLQKLYNNPQGRLLLLEHKCADPVSTMVIAFNIVGIPLTVAVPYILLIASDY